MYKRRLVFWSACIGMLLFGITIITLGSVVPGLKEKFKLNEISSGTLFSILPMGILTGSLLFGPFCDKYGYRILLSISCFCMCAGFACIAFSDSHTLLKICIFLFGLGGGAINGATNAVVADISDTNKGANLSLLGVFYGIGALGMPLLLGALQHVYHFEIIVAAVGYLTFATGAGFLLIKFPPPKQAQGFPIARSLALIKDEVLVLIAFFLFCQSSFEGIINNWTTTYLAKRLFVEQNNALYALSLFIVGMVAMRLLLGSLFRSVSIQQILAISFVLVLLGCMLLEFGNSFPMAVTGLILLGAGLAAGFPVMLGLVGNRFAELSGTAFSFVLVIALLGNILVNYAMGLIIHSSGIQYLIKMAFAELIAMTIISILILKKIKIPKQS